MPLLKGKSKKVIKKNFREFGEGKTYAATKKKFGARKANKQRIAVVLSTARGKHKKG
jgi:hypothetical protein